MGYGPNYYTSLERCQGEVGPGWAKLVERCWEAAQEAGASVIQVKEKLGGLRFYTHCKDKDAADKLHETIKQAEQESRRTCEHCGEPGEIRRDYPEWVRFVWLLTLCDQCWAKRLKKLEEQNG